MTKLEELIKMADAAEPKWFSTDNHTSINARFIAAANPAIVKRMAELLVQCREALKYADEVIISHIAEDALSALDTFEREGK